MDFELHWERNLARLMRELDDHTFSPSAYTFISPRPAPREVFACEMALRVVHHYIDERMRPLIEEELTNRTFNNRIGYGGVEAINTLISDIYEVSQGFTKDAWIIKMDLSGYFPNADQNIVFKQLSDLTLRRYEGEDKDLLLYMIMRSVFSYPAKHCYRKSALYKWEDIPDAKSLFKKPDGIGGAIGHLIWQNAMNYYLNDLDHWLSDKNANSCGLHFVRFVDDMVIVTDNKECTLALIGEIRKRLADVGCTLHPRKFYCQHYTKGVNFIGSTIKMDRVYASNRNVRNFRKTIHDFNKCVRVTRLEAFLSSMNSYLGILKTRNGYAIIRNMLEEVNPEWLKFCHFDAERLCFVANRGYTHKELLSRKYHLKFKKKHGKKNRTQQTGITPAGAAC